jgi:hypothetical protein
MKWALIFACLCSCAATDPRINDQWAPAKFDRETYVRVHFVMTFGQIDAICGKAPLPYQRAGCVRSDALGKFIVLPHPSIVTNRPIYGQMVAHELGHVNGWSATHDN